MFISYNGLKAEAELMPTSQKINAMVQGNNANTKSYSQKSHLVLCTGGHDVNPTLSVTPLSIFEQIQHPLVSRHM